MIPYLVIPPAVPRMIEDWAFTWFVDTVKIALVAPAGTVALGGTVAAAVLSLDRETARPPAGAAEVSVTVPVDAFPPITSLGSTLTADSAAVEEEDDELTVQPESVAVAEVPDPSSTATRQSDGGEKGSRSILKFPAPSLVPIATPFTVMVRLGAAVPSSRRRVPESSALEMRTVASADGIAMMLRPKASESSASGRRTRLMIPPTLLR